MKKTVKIIALAMVALMLMLALVSCGATPKADPAEAEKALKDNGYKTEMLPGGDATDITATVVGVSEDRKQQVRITYYKDATSAEGAYNELKKNLDGLEEKSEYDLEVGISDTVVWYGTSDAIKAAS